MKNVLMDTNQGSTTTIDGMPIGRLTPASGNFSELAVNGEPITPGGGRTRLTADTDYHVATTGSDTTGDGSVGGPWATISKAVSFVEDEIDCNGFQPRIKVADGDYPEYLQLGNLTGLSGDFYYDGPGNVSYPSATIEGNFTTPANVTIAPTSNPDGLFFGILANGPTSRWRLGGITADLSGITFGENLGAMDGALLHIINSIKTITSSGGTETKVIYCLEKGTVRVGYEVVFVVSGNFQNFIYAFFTGYVDFEPDTLTFLGTPTATDCVIQSSQSSLVIFYANTITATITGKRFNGAIAGNIFTFGSGLTFVPGTVAGTLDATSGYDDIQGPLPNVGTATASASAATLNLPNGVITSQALTTATTFTLTLTNSFITANSVVIVNPTNSGGTVTNLLSVTPSAGQVIVAVSMTSLTGTVKIAFQVLN